MTGSLLEKWGKEDDLSVRRCVSSRRRRKGDNVSSASVTSSLLYKKAVGHLPRGPSFTQSSFIFLPIHPTSTLSLTVHTHTHTYSLSLFSYEISPNSLFQSLPHTLTLSGSVKSDRLQVCFTVKEDSLLLYACNLSA